MLFFASILYVQSWDIPGLVLERMVGWGIYHIPRTHTGWIRKNTPENVGSWLGNLTTRTYQALTLIQSTSLMSLTMTTYTHTHVHFMLCCTYIYTLLLHITLTLLGTLLTLLTLLVTSGCSNGGRRHRDWNVTSAESRQRDPVTADGSIWQGSSSSSSSPAPPLPRPSSPLSSPEPSPSSAIATARSKDLRKEEP